MPDHSFFVIAWNNGAHHSSGAGYGVKISARDRDTHFKTEWRTVSLHLPDRSDPVAINVNKKSFWNGTCRELISRELARGVDD